MSSLNNATILSAENQEGFTQISGTNILSNNIIVDNISPIITVFHDLANLNTYTTNHKFTVTASDVHSDVASNNQFTYYLSNDVKTIHTGFFNDEVTISSEEPCQINISVKDNAGNESSYTSPVINFDRTNPSAIFEIAENVNAQSVTLTDNRAGLDDTATYEIYSNGGSLAESGTLTGLSGSSLIKSISLSNLSDGEYYIKVKPIDIVGNTAEYTSSVFYVDKDIPSLVITPNSEGANNNQQQYNINISASDSNGAYSDGSISKIKYRWRDGSWITTDNKSSVEFNYENGGNSGSELLEVQAFDNSIFNNFVTLSRAFSFDHTAPVVDFSSSVFGNIVNNAEIEVMTEEANNIARLSYAIRTNSTKNIDGSDWTTIEPGDVTNIRHITLTKDTGNGNFYYHVKAIDEAGNEGYYVSDVFIMDTTGVDGNINRLEELTNLDTINVNINTSETNGVTYATSEDNITFSPYSLYPVGNNFMYKFNNTSDGNRYLYVRFKDATRNVTSAQDTVMIDATKPTASVQYSTTSPTRDSVIATITNLSDNHTQSGNVTVNVTTHTFENNGSFDFEIADEAGNTNVITATVNWIDRIKPSISFSPNGDISYSRTKDVLKVIQFLIVGIQ